MGMSIGVVFAKIGNKILTILAIIIVIISLTYGINSLYNVYLTYKGSYLSDELLKYKPVDNGTSDNPSLAQLQEINKDVRAWITIDDTYIDYPVVQGKDNMEYINKDVYGNFSLPGSIFLSSENTYDFSDKYNLLFGHHMANRGMFSDVTRFKNKEMFDTHTTGTLYTVDNTFEIQIFAVVDTVSYDHVIYYPENYKYGTKLSELLTYVKSNALYYRDLKISNSDQIIALSTCENATTNGRTVLFGKLVKKYGETALDISVTGAIKQVNKGKAAKKTVYGKSINDHWALFNLICVITTILITVTLFFQSQKQLEKIEKNLDKKREELEKTKEKFRCYEQQQRDEEARLRAVNIIESNNGKQVCKLTDIDSEVITIRDVECISEFVEVYNNFFEDKKKFIFFQEILISTISIISVMIFIITEDVTKMMQMFDRWSFLMFVMVVLTLLLLLLKGRKDITNNYGDGDGKDKDGFDASLYQDEENFKKDIHDFEVVLDIIIT